MVSVRFLVAGGSRLPNPAQPEETGFYVSEEERPLRSSKLPLSAILAFVLFAPWMLVSGAAADEADTLKRAIVLFDEGDYTGAQEALTGVDRSKLSAAQQTLRDDYLARSQVAITMSEKAVRDLEDAETAIKEKELDRAKQLLDSVLGNKYAAAKLKQSADDMKRGLGGGSAPAAVRPSDPKPAEVSPPASPAPESKPPEPRPQETKPAATKPTNGEAKAKNGNGAAAAGGEAPAVRNGNGGDGDGAGERTRSRGEVR